MEYWQDRAKKEGKTYGEEPSVAARLALPHLDGAHSILEIGGAYGRNTLLFAEKGFKITVIDPCQEWINLLKQVDNPLISTLCTDILTVDLDQTFDAVFSNFVLHFFKPKELPVVFQKTHSWLRPGGLFINSWLSNKDIHSPSNYLNKQIYIHHFGYQELKKLHHKSGFKLEAINKLKEFELINTKDEKTTFWFTVARKTQEIIK